MELTSYQYCLLRYSPDRVSGEFLNIGLVALCQEPRRVIAKTARKLARLGCAFPGIDVDSVRRTCKHIETVVRRIDASLEGVITGIEPDYPLQSLKKLCEYLVPDQALSVHFSEVFNSDCMDLDTDVDYWYHEFVGRYEQAGSWKRRDDSEVWKSVQSAVEAELGSNIMFTQHAFGGSVDLELEHAFLNHKWHAIEPVSLDYAEVRDIKDKVNELLGLSVRLQEAPDFGTLTIVVGEPRDEQKAAIARHQVDALARLLPPKDKIFEEKHLGSLADRVQRIANNDYLIHDSLANLPRFNAPREVPPTLPLKEDT